MVIKTISVDGIEFMVQSYKAGDFCHIVSSIEKHSVAIDLKTMKVDGSYSSQNDDWKEFCSNLNIEAINKELSQKMT